MKDKTTRISLKKEGVMILICLAAVCLMLLRPCEGLDGQGHLTMGFTIILIGCWILKPFGLPNAVSGFLFLGIMLICRVPADTVLSGFSQSALWTLLPALFLGFALQKSGLGKRIAVTLMRLFPSNWLAVICAWLLIGIVLSLVTPSMTVRAVIMIPIALQCCELYELTPGSNESSFLIITAIAAALVPGNAWITGNLTAPIVQGIFDQTPGIEGMLTFDRWLGAAVLPVGITSVLAVILGYFLVRPKQKLSREKLKTNSSEMTRLNRSELITLIVLVLCCILFFTGTYHKIPSSAVCLVAAALLFLSGVLEKDDFAIGVNWDLIFFFGTGLSLNRIFQETGLSGWIAEAISPVVGMFHNKSMIFILLLTVILFLWRFVDVTTLIPTTVILAPIVRQVFLSNGIHPVIWGVIIALASCSFFLTYTNMWAFMGKKMVGRFAWSEGQLSRYGLALFLAAMTGIAAAIPVWISGGLIS